MGRFRVSLLCPHLSQDLKMKASIIIALASVLSLTSAAVVFNTWDCTLDSYGYPPNADLCTPLPPAVAGLGYSCVTLRSSDSYSVLVAPQTGHKTVLFTDGSCNLPDSVNGAAVRYAGDQNLCVSGCVLVRTMVDD